MLAAHSQALLVPTKLTPPQMRESWVMRGRLLDILGPQPTTRLTLVVAPAGFGKSTLVGQWLLGHAQPQGLRAIAFGAAPTQAPPTPRSGIAWLTIDEHDQDALRFLAYLCGAIERAAPGTLATSLPLLATADPPSFVVIQALLVDLSALPTPLTLVLDDYHAVVADSIHKVVTYLLRHLPPHCRMVLITRVDPPLSLTRLRAERQLTEVRAADLRFSEAETGALLTKLLSTTPEAEQVAALHEQTEGWAIAVQLAALARLDARTPDLVSGVVNRQIAEYLADEVFDQQPAPIKQLLLALAVPERFCARLCATLLDLDGGELRAESLLDQLVRANLFLSPIDEAGRWHRFHHLFRDLLLRRLRLSVGPEQLRTIELRAARWFAAEGLAEEAVRHFLAAGDEEAAADLVERLLIPEMGKDVAGVPMGYWLRLLPDAVVARRPGLALMMARLAVFSMDIGDFQAKLARVDALLAEPHTLETSPPWPTFEADLATLRGTLCFWQGRPAETIAQMQAALAQGPTLALTTQALLQLALSYVGNGTYADGVRQFEAGLPVASERLGPLYRLYQYSCLANMHQLAGELAAQERAARLLAETVDAHEAGDLWVGYAAASLGLVAYERSELATASAHFGTLVAGKYRVSYPGYMSGVIGLALVACARGAFAEAAPYVREALAFADELGGAFLHHQALGCAVRVALAQGDLPTAQRAAAGIGRDMHIGVSLPLETPRLSQVRALVAAGDEAALTQAEALLARCLEEIEPLHHTRLLIAALGVLAILRQAQGRQDEALAALERAVGLAAPRGFVRTLADLGPALEPLLHALAARGVAPGSLERLRAALTAGTPAPERPRFPALSAASPELLTRRELEILGLLAERWSDKEIAERLVIAPNTVRKHTSTIYDKLGVNSRREAVDVAQALGLLTPA